MARRHGSRWRRATAAPNSISGLPAHQWLLRFDHFEELDDDLRPPGHTNPNFTADGRVDDHVGAHPVRCRVFRHQHAYSLGAGTE